VKEAIVVGDGRPFLVALIVVDHDEAARAASSEEEVRSLIQGVVEAANAGRGRHEHVRRFAVLPRDLTQEARELTPTLKVRRRVCEEHFHDEIERLYAAV
jgi:long-chain acyl-CoA synthetase